MQVFFFLDLDDTIFQSRTKCPAGEPLYPVAYGRDGAPRGYMTRRQRRLLGCFQRLGTVIPVTGRNSESFRRVRLEFRDAAVLAFGGVVLLPGGVIDPVWDGSIRPQALHTGPCLREALKAVREFDARESLGATARIVWDFGMPLYLVIKHPARDLAALRAIAESGALPGDERWFIHFNGNNLSLAPRFLGKERAVAYLREHRSEVGASLTVGVGDSITDAAFLDQCDWALTPRGSQLYRHWLGEA